MLFIKFFGGKLILVAGAVTLVVLIAVVGCDERETRQQAPTEPTKSYREASPGPVQTPVGTVPRREQPPPRATSVPRRITFTAFELECMQWGDSFIGTDWYNLLRDNPDQYGRFQRTAVPLCRDMAQKARDFCRVARSEGHDPAEYVRARNASLEVIGAVHIWCD